MQQIAALRKSLEDVSIPVDKVRAVQRHVGEGATGSFQSPWIRFARKWELLECNLRHVSIPVDKVRAAHLGALHGFWAGFNPRG